MPPPPAPVPPRPPKSRVEEAERAAALALFLRALLALIVFVLAADVASAVHIRRDRQRPASVDPAAVAPGPAGPTPHTGVGPLDGIDAPAYVSDRALALQAATGRRSAVVSFGAYVTEAAARALLSGLDVDGFLVAARGGSPSVTADLGAWATAEHKAAADQQTALQQLIPTVSDPAFKADYRARLAEIRVLLTSIDPRGTVVFGAVVRGPVPVLQALARNPAVRLVDVGVDGLKLQPAETRGLRPEETTKVGTPETRPTA
jgi:hypothetical protein